LKTDLLKDILAGLTVAALHIPQATAFSMLIGLCPITGFYVSFFPSLVYVFMGTSRHISLGKFEVLSFLSFSHHLSMCPLVYVFMTISLAMYHSSHLISDVSFVSSLFCVSFSSFLIISYHVYQSSHPLSLYHSSYPLSMYHSSHPLSIYSRPLHGHISLG